MSSTTTPVPVSIDGRTGTPGGLPDMIRDHVARRTDGAPVARITATLVEPGRVAISYPGPQGGRVPAGHLYF